MRILLETEAVRHWKMERLCSLLDEPLAALYPIRLWLWAFNQAKDGDLSRFEPRDLAIAMGWKGRPKRLIAALIKVRLLDENPLRIHDWEEHNGGKLRDYETRAAWKRDQRAREAAARALRQEQPSPGKPETGYVDGYVPGHVPVTPSRPVPSRPVPSLPPPKPSNGGEGEGLRSSGEGPEGGGGGLPDGTWEVIWRELPNRRGYWERRARKELEAVLVPEEVTAFLEWLGRKKHTRSWEQSPPTPPAVALEYIERRRKPAARAGDTPKRRATDPDRAQIRASWAGVAEAAAAQTQQAKRGGS